MKAFIKDIFSVFLGVSKVKNVKGYYSNGSLDRPGVWWH